MRIEHIAIWVKDLEKMRQFYEDYFDASASEKYINEKKGFASYFLTMNSECRIELMTRTDIFSRIQGEQFGYAHIAISLGSKEKVDQFTEIFRNDHFEIIGEPRITGDGYYESVILDPEGNRIELTI
ncbi:VOC family protein [Listeria fleischmannii]|jgi:lactoylglutathione lyase|uniref:Glyoxalase family protein n=2 Tax=Listeria fleischmannii TaxID=1069827 RepID=W7DS57_9LIST|nr:VOC family protein [Listeria fleischmannii]EUJ53487.1 glyoxalase family protein [Listeria fleischmannii FSL S10-1203]MBC1398639.1 glyoxalase/bleomycin resistance/extradiol dioxygenase family protein [Listeria fleischmannii]MBC1418238.1 glyoxalase/bleomycin resistance/extradiol dioxygenase family protein [Listeria fleischmannii]MBC1427017.1 glyoxalase/bleomycin resistance/extradiol dioxygenase family protein [Listeria fleischmannii]